MVFLQKVRMVQVKNHAVSRKWYILDMKLMIWVGILAGGTIGGLIGAALDRGNMLGTWSIVLSTAGSLAGVWAGYKIGKAYL